jgi:hypothetical protein
VYREAKGESKRAIVRWTLRTAPVRVEVSEAVERKRSHGALAVVPPPAPAFNGEVSGPLLWPAGIHCGLSPVGSCDRG